MSKIAIVGLQHQGVIQAACFAEKGHDVVGVDSSARNVLFLNKGKSCLREEGLDELLEKNLKISRLKFSTHLAPSIKGADFIFLSIDAEITSEGVNVEPIIDMAYRIKSEKNAESIFCVTSQVPVGTTESFSYGPLAYIPEFLRPGQSVDDFLYPDRIVIGTRNKGYAGDVERLYSSFGAPIFHMSLRSAEMAKHVHNAILATQISFANEISDLCSAEGAEIKDVIKSTKADRRVGLLSYLNPGWTLSGGHLIRDLRVLRGLGVAKEIKTPLLNAVATVDEGR
jgi:UDPglucose 6-dehydrogenase